MIGIKATIWSIVCGVAIQVSLVSTATLADDRNSIVVVKSSDNSYFNQTIQTLINRTDQSVKLRVIDAGSSAAETSLLEKSKLVIALGVKATHAITHRFPDKPITFYIPLFGDLPEYRKVRVPHAGYVDPEN